MHTPGNRCCWSETSINHLTRSGVPNQALCDNYPEVVAGTHREDFAAGFADRPLKSLPCGRRYFRVWNDGRLQGCPNLPHVADLFDCGNVKERRLKFRQADFMCDSPRFCDCHVIDGLGKNATPSRKGCGRRGWRSRAEKVDVGEATEKAASRQGQRIRNV